MSFERDLVIVQPGRLTQATDEVEENILKDPAKWGLYQFGDMLVRVVVTSPEDAERELKRTHIKRPVGATVLRPATAPMLEDVFGRAMGFAKYTGKKGELQPIDCPEKIATFYLSRGGLWKLPYLVGIVSAPILRPDGSILTEPGYDEATGLLLDSPIRWHAPASLSRAAVEQAVRTLLGPFAEFHFRGELNGSDRSADRSVVVSAILTGIQRRLLHGGAPLHAHDAPIQSSGKTLLADSISIIVTGLPAVSISFNPDPEELRKKLTSVLLAGDACPNIDNVTQPLRSDALATILTVDIYVDRILGLSRVAHLPTNCLFQCTGNNISLSGDMPSRALVDRIEPNCERPEERTFAISDLRAHVTEHRVELVTAALTILQAYHKVGTPQKLPESRFSQWSKEIRAAIVWAGLADPCKTRESIAASDPERESTLAVFRAWYAVRGESAITLSNLVADFERDDVKIEGLLAELRTVLLEIAADRLELSRISTHRLGAWCRNHVDRIAGGFKLQKGPDARAGFGTWQVVRVDGAEHASDDEKVVSKELPILQ